MLAVGLPTIGLFDYAGLYEFAPPFVYGCVMLAIVIMAKWKLRRHVWFWATICAIVCLHAIGVWVIAENSSLLTAWSTTWIPAAVITPFAVLDLYAMLWLISSVGKRLEHSDPF